VPGIDIMGTLNEPVHATNLKDAIAEIEMLDQRPLVIAVDACLGRSENVGYINVCRGPLKPGTGVNKVLPEVGDMHITGIVNVGGYMEYLVLQNTRLGLVMRMATSIAKAIQYAAGVDRPSVQTEGLREKTSPILARRESAVADGTPPSAVGPRL
jgi:putative sporulation protein YyaC